MKASLLALAAVLTLSACGSDADAPGSAAGEAGGESGGAIASARGGEACLVGTWAADPEHTFRPENFQRLMGGGGEGAPSIRLTGTSGRALITFEPGGGMNQSFDDFAIMFDADADDMAMKMTMALTGANESRYETEGDRLTFHPDGSPDGNTIHGTISMEMGGQTLPPQELDSAMFEAQGDNNGGTVVTYECNGDELLLDIATDAASGNMFFRDARYTRAG